MEERIFASLINGCLIVDSLPLPLIFDVCHSHYFYFYFYFILLTFILFFRLSPPYSSYCLFFHNMFSKAVSEINCTMVPLSTGYIKGVHDKFQCV